jgi:four helix bundle protein
MRCEQLEVWKRSRIMTIEIYKLVGSINDYGFKNQITRSCLSIPSNIAEGFEKNYEKEKARYLTISKGSLGEFKTQLDIGIEIGYIPRKQGLLWMEEAETLSRMLENLIKKLKSS